MKKLFTALILFLLPSLSHGYQTIFNPFTQKLDFVGVSSANIPSGSTQYIQNTQTLQSGATFYVSSGTVAKNFGLRGGINFVSLNSQSANYTATSTDTFISMNAAGGVLTVTLNSAASLVGQLLHIDKSDISANAVTVKTAGTETIAYSTGSLLLNAQGQGVELISDGVSNWKLPNGFQATPPFIGYVPAPNTAASVTTSSNTALVAVYVPVPVRMTGLRVNVGVASGQWQVGLYDAYGVRVASSTEVAMSATGSTTLSFVSAVNIPPGLYYLALGSDNTTSTFARAGSACVAGTNLITTNMPMAASVTLPGTATANCFAFAGIVTGGISQ